MGKKNTEIEFIEYILFGTGVTKFILKYVSDIYLFNILTWKVCTTKQIYYVGGFRNAVTK